MNCNLVSQLKMLGHIGMEDEVKINSLYHGSGKLRDQEIHCLDDICQHTASQKEDGKRVGINSQ